MGVSESLIVDLEDAIRRGNPDKRADTLRRVTELFVVRAPNLNEEQVALFGSVIGNLIEAIEMKALVELGARVAQIVNAPPEVMRRLANHDDIAVSGPVLEHSERLTDADLVDTAETKSQAHLLAISARRRLNEPVTDVLVRRGDAQVMRKVAANSGARFSPHGFDVLAERARTDGTLAVDVARRSDIPPHVLHDLVTRATAAVRQSLLAVTRPETHGDIARMLAKVSAEIGADVASANEDSTIRTLRLMHDAGQLGERDLTEFAKSGRFDETVAALSLLCAMPLEIVDSLMREHRVDPIIVLCKSAGLGWPTTWAVTCARRDGHGGTGLDAETVRDDFDKLSRSTAERAIRFWRVRQLASDPTAGPAADTLSVA